MQKTRRLLVFGFILLTGCNPAVQSAADRFDQQHGDKTITPDGRIIKGSARETDGGIEYRTEGGKIFKTTPNADGSFGDVKRVK